MERIHEYKKKVITNELDEIYGSNDGEYEDYCILDYSTL